MTDKTINDYYKFLEEQEKSKKLALQSIMILLLGQLTSDLNEFGWEKKGNGGVTNTMVNTEVLKFDFVKNDLTLTVLIDLKEKYGDSGYRELILKNGNPITEKGWRKNGTRGTFGIRGFVLQDQLHHIDRYNP